MKKILALLFATLLMTPGTVFSSTGGLEIGAQEIDFSLLMDMPGFYVEYSEDDSPLWIAYEDQESLIDEYGCYVIPTIAIMQTDVGVLMMLQLDAGHYAAPESMVDIQEFTILVDNAQFTFSAPQIWATSTEEYGMVLCGQEAVAMLEDISSTTRPVYVVLKGKEGSFAYEMTEAQQGAIQTLVEGGRKAGLFSNKMVLDMAQSYTPATISAVSDENKMAVDDMGKAPSASAASNASSAEEGPQVDYSVFNTLPGFAVQSDEKTGNFAVYSTDGDPLFTNDDICFEPLIGSIMGAPGYAPLFFLSLSVYGQTEFIIHEATFIVGGSRYTFSPSLAGNVTLSNVFRISCGPTAQKMLQEMMGSRDPVEIEIASESDTLTFTMTDAQRDAVQALYNAYLDSGAAAHAATQRVAEDISPVLVELGFMAKMPEVSIIPGPTIKPTTDVDLPIDSAPFQNLPGIVMEKDDAAGQYRFVYANPVELAVDTLNFMQAYVATIHDAETDETSLVYFLEVSSQKISPTKLYPKTLHFTVDGMRYELSNGRTYDTDQAAGIHVPCGTVALDMLEKIVSSPNPVMASIVCSKEVIHLTLTEKQIEVLKMLYDAYMLTGFAKDDLLREIDETGPITITDAAEGIQMPKGPVLELDDGSVLSDESFIVHAAENNQAHYTEDGYFIEPVLVYDAKEGDTDLVYSLAVGKDPAAAPPETVTITIDGKEYTHEIKLTRGFLHLTYALIPCGPDEYAMIDAILNTKNPIEITLTTKGESAGFTMTQSQIKLFELIHDE